MFKNAKQSYISKSYWTVARQLHGRHAIYNAFTRNVRGTIPFHSTSARQHMKTPWDTCFPKRACLKTFGNSSTPKHIRFQFLWETPGGCHEDFTPSLQEPKTDQAVKSPRGKHSRSKWWESRESVAESGREKLDEKAVKKTVKKMKSLVKTPWEKRPAAVKTPWETR